MPSQPPPVPWLPAPASSRLSPASRPAQSPARRLQVKPLAQGGQIIDDSYNASPESVRAAIDVLASRPGYVESWCFGDMG